MKECSVFARAAGERMGPRKLAAAIAMLAWGAADPAAAFETKVSGRIGMGAVFRTQERAPDLLVSYNAAAMGLTGLAASGQNTDDGNNNFRRGDAVSRALTAFLEFRATQGELSGVVRIKAWHDDALNGGGRPWGNSINGYTPGAPLGDRGAARLSRFSGVALGDYYVQHTTRIANMGLTSRIGQQSLSWGERSSFPGGLSALNATDFPALRRAGAVPPQWAVPAPMAYARLQLAPAAAVEAFYQTRFRPSALDLCGTFWAITDYSAQGCNRTFSGALPASDAVRLRGGSYLKRVDSPTPTGDGQYGAGLTWRSATLGADFGLYHARYTSRTPVPGLRKSSRAGPAVLLNDPDGKNLAYFTEYVGDIRMTALTFQRPGAHGAWFGELAVRPRQPVQLPAGDVLPAFLSPTAPSLIRQDADAVAPGGIYHAYDRYRTAQLQLGVRHDWGRVGGVALSGVAEVVGKHASGLPDPALRRYGRADLYGAGPVKGVCAVTSNDRARQCSFDGYVTANALAYRLRLDGRFATPIAALLGQAWVALTHDVKGWSYDFSIHEGRRSLNIGMRFEYQRRYTAEVSFVPLWGGVYNAQRDRDQLAVAVGVRF